MDVGFIGLGAMGAGMAARLVHHGHAVRVWNRSPEPADKLRALGAVKVDTPREAFAGDAVITMLANDEAIRSVILDERLLDRAPGSLVHVVSATISVGLAAELEQAHAARGLRYVAAPVLGRPNAAAGGELNILAAGPPDAIEQVRPLLDAMGKKTWPFGSEPHHANVAKLACNFLLAAAIEGMAEALVLGKRHGLEPRSLLDVITGTLFAAPAYLLYGPAIVERNFEPAGFKLALGLKDVRLALGAGEAVSAPMPFASVLRDNFLDAVAHGDADKDWAAVADVAARRAGLIGGLD